MLSIIALTDIFITLDIPILRQVFGFALLTFLPGFLIIRILRFGKTYLDKTLFLIGLSVAFLLFVPLLMNFAYPPLGISRPISLSPLVITFSVILAGLSLAAYKKGAIDLEIHAGGFKNLIRKILTPPILGAALIFIMGILGGLSVMFYLDSIFSLLLGLSVVLIVVLIIIDKVSPRFYPLYIFVIAIALQYSRTLASLNLFGSDAMYELYFANLVKFGGVWDPSYSINFIVSRYSAMLSVSILPTVYSILLNLSTVWVYKLVYPFVFAFVPVGLYEIFRTQVKFSSKSAFLAAFLFVSFFAFFQAMPAVPRQEIAELFFVLAVLLFVKRYSQASKKAALLILFIGSMVVSHYATSFVFLFYLGIVVLGSALVSRTKQKRAESAVLVTIVIFAIVFTLGWYLVAGAGTPFQGFLDTVIYTLKLISTGAFFNSSDPYVRAGLGSTQAGFSLVQVLAHYWQLIIEALILTGFVSALWRGKPKMSPKFFFFALGSFLLLLAVAALPSLQGAINVWRSYSFALMFLAPFCIIGLTVIVGFISGWLGANRGLVSKLTSVALILLFVPYFLFSYGFISEIAEKPANYALLPTQNLNGRGVEYSNNAAWSYMIQGPVPSESVYASTWVSRFVNHSYVYTDWIRAPELAAYGHVSPESVIIFTNSTAKLISSKAFIYLGAANVQQKSIVLLGFYTGQGELNTSSVRQLTAASRVYDSGLCKIYRTR
jgi:uncharacterized membrane protein